MVLAGIGGLGAPELLIILVIVVVLFGAGRLAGIGGALGQSIKEFRKASHDPEAEERERRAEERRRAEEAGRYTATGTPPPAANGTGPSEYRPGAATEPAPTPTPAPSNRPPDFTSRP